MFLISHIMDSTRSWFKKLQIKGRKEPGENKEIKDGNNAPKPMNMGASSNETKQKVEAAKQYIENHYKSQMKCLEERKQRYLLQLFSVLSLLECFGLWQQ